MHYVIGVGPAPDGYEVSPHLLNRIDQPLNMTRYLDPTYACILDVISILKQGLPSVDKDFRLQYDSRSAKYYQHTSNNIRLVSGTYNMAKGSWLTAHVAGLIEYLIFIYQTALQVIGKEEALALVDRIKELVHTAFLEGESLQPAQESPAEVLEDFAVKLSLKIMADVCGPLSQQRLSQATKARKQQEGQRQSQSQTPHGQI